MIDILLSLLSIFVLCVAAVRQPTRIVAAQGWHAPTGPERERVYCGQRRAVVVSDRVVGCQP